MRTALVRIIADWLAAGNGGTESLAALLPGVPREPGDDLPTIPVIDDETRDGFLARGKATPDGAAYPCVAVWYDGPAARGPATNQPHEELTGRVMVAYLARDPGTEAAIRAGDYVLRAAQRSVHRLVRETPAASEARTRGGVYLEAITASEWRGADGMSDDVWITGALALEVRVRDLAPEG